MGRVYADDIGTWIRLDAKTDLTAATKVAIKARDPSGVVVELTGVVVDNTKIRYIKETNALDVVGLWHLQSYVEWESEVYYGETSRLRVYESL